MTDQWLKPVALSPDLEQLVVDAYNVEMGQANLLLSVEDTTRMAWLDLRIARRALQFFMDQIEPDERQRIITETQEARKDFFDKPPAIRFRDGGAAFDEAIADSNYLNKTPSATKAANTAALLAGLSLNFSND